MARDGGRCSPSSSRGATSSTRSSHLDPDLFTLPLGLRSLATLDRTVMLAKVGRRRVATATVVVLFLVAQRWFLHEFRGAHWLAR